MTYNPRIVNIDNNSVNVSGTLTINKVDTILTVPSIVSSKITASNVVIDTLQINAIDSTLNILQTNTIYVTSNIMLTSSQHTILADALTSSFTITLPDISTVPNQEYVIKKVDNTYNAVNIYGGLRAIPFLGFVQQTIDTTYDTVTLSTQNDSITLINDATGSWYII